ncbi:hypothetical protein DV515_00016321 [Chloebia gouldiae]|uniref:RNA-directed DNA polymerase n=1 Tax=Chloebia gouldiae TaxID=44316 RepID=A0A3L8RSK6_CHLGU|nr:hypothetical protein DV515_00016321 [Chloebia gouldiae]
MMAELIKKGRERLIEITGTEPSTIRIPMKKDTFEWYLETSQDLQEALLEGGSQIETHKLRPPPVHWMGQWDWIVRPKKEKNPIREAITAFTDAGKKSRMAAITWQEEGVWKQQLLHAAPEDSLQTMELLAVIWALMEVTGPLNVVTDSLYVAGVVDRIEEAFTREVKNKRLFELLMQLKKATRMRINAYAVIHIRSHKWEEGLGEGNARADKLVSIVQETPLAKHALAKEAHSIFHQNAKGLSKEFKIPLTEAKMLVWACPICSHHNGGQGLGLRVNPRELQSNELWQMDVTHIARFSRLKYVHVSINTYNKFIWATPQVREKAIHVEQHLLSCFAVLGVSKRIKTDNGPAYTSKKIAQFLQTWGVDHIKRIPHSPTRQAIIKRAH